MVTAEVIRSRRATQHGHYARRVRTRPLRSLALACVVGSAQALQQDDAEQGTWGSWMPEAVERILNAAQMQRRAIFDHISEKQQASMLELFKKLDKNEDGAIQLEEFRGMTLSAWAAFQMLSMDTFSIQEGQAMLQEFVNLPEILPQRIIDKTPSWFRLPSRAERARMFTSWALSRYVGLLCFLQLSVVVYENLRCFFGCYRWSMPNEPMSHASLKQSSREEVLEYDTPWRKSRYETCKLVFMTVSGLALVRFIAACTFFAMGVLLINLAALREEGPWRTFWWACGRSIIWCFLGSLGFYKVHVRGELANKEYCKLLLGNHVGTFELFGLYALAFPSFVSRSSNLNLPLFNGIVIASDAILVDRENAESKELTMNAIKAFTAEPGGRQLMLFPEGTCNNQKTIFRFSRGAFSTGRNPVQLVLFKFPYRHFNPCYTGVAVGGHEFWDLMWRSCCQFVQYMEVEFLPPYMPSEEEVADPTMFANHMQRVMAAHLHCTINDFNYKLYQEVYSDYLRDQQKQRASRRISQLLQTGDCLRRSSSSQKMKDKDSDKED